MLPNPPGEIHKIRIATWTAQVLLAEIWGKFSCRVVDLAMNQAAKPCKPKVRSTGTICGGEFPKIYRGQSCNLDLGTGNPSKNPHSDHWSTNQPTNQPTTPPKYPPPRNKAFIQGLIGLIKPLFLRGWVRGGWSISQNTEFQWPT